jgi:hypothetical protein
VMAVRGCIRALPFPYEGGALCCPMRAHAHIITTPDEFVMNFERVCAAFSKFLRLLRARSASRQGPSHSCIGLRRASAFPSTITPGMPQVPEGCLRGFWHYLILGTLNKLRTRGSEMLQGIYWGVSSVRRPGEYREDGHTVSEESKSWHVRFSYLLS